MPIAQIEEQAKYLARKNREAEPEIIEVFWFPDEHEVRLLEVLENVPFSDEQIAAIYFRADPQQHLPAPSGIALARPDEVRTKKLPPDWGGWEAAKRITRDGVVE